MRKKLPLSPLVHVGPPEMRHPHFKGAVKHRRRVGVRNNESHMRTESPFGRDRQRFGIVISGDDRLGSARRRRRPKTGASRHFKYAPPRSATGDPVLQPSKVLLPFGGLLQEVIAGSPFGSI